MGFEAGGACGSDMVHWCVRCCFLSVLKRSVTKFLRNWCNTDAELRKPQIIEGKPKIAAAYAENFAKHLAHSTRYER